MKNRLLSCSNICTGMKEQDRSLGAVANGCQKFAKTGGICIYIRTGGELGCPPLLADPLLLQSSLRGHCGQAGDCLSHRTGDR